MKKEQRILPPGWKWIWTENPWTEKLEKLMIPHEEVERRKRKGKPCKTLILGRKRGLGVG